MHRIPLLVPFVLAACFGGGPTPTPPTEATLAFATPIPPRDQLCSDSVYNGPITFDNTNGYVMTLPFNAANIPGDNCGNGGGGGSPSLPVAVTVFPLDGSNPLGTTFPMGGAGNYNSGATRPALTTDGTMPAWLYVAGPDLTLGPETTKLMLSGASVGGNGVLAAALDASNLYVLGAGANMGQLRDPFDPTYPNGGGGGSGPLNAVLGKVALPVVAGGMATVTPMTNLNISCGELDRCMVANATTLFVMTSSGPQATLQAFPKAGGGATQIFAVSSDDQITNPVPVGLDTDGQHVALAIANDATSSFPLRAGCQILINDGTQSTGLFYTKKWSCMDVAVAGDWVYFTIVGSSSCNNCGGNSALQGLGIGRVSISTQEVDTIGLGLAVQGHGPRRVHVVGDSIYAVDPFAVVRIPTSELDGKHDQF